MALTLKVHRTLLCWLAQGCTVFGIPYNTHCDLINLICNDIPMSNQIDKITFQFFDSCVSYDNEIVRLCQNLVYHGSQSIVCNIIAFRCSKYGIRRTDFSCKLDKCQWFIINIFIQG